MMYLLCGNIWEWDNSVGLNLSEGILLEEINRGGNSQGCNFPDFSSIFHESYGIYAIQCISRGKVK